MNNGAGLPNLSVQQLDYLVAVHEAPTWADAAARVGVTPSALSQGLAELERRLGVALFDRQGRRRVPTEAAAVVLDHARAVLARTQDLATWAERRRSGRTGGLRVGMIDAAATIHGAAALAAFRAERPDVGLHLQVSPSAELLQGLAGARLDVVVCVAPAVLPDGVAAVPFLAEDLAVYAPPRGSPRAWGPWVTYPHGSRTRELALGALRAAGRAVTVVAESHQPEVLAQMVALGLGWSVLPVGQVERSGTDVRRIGRAPLVRRPLIIGRRSHGPADPAADALVELLGRSRRAAPDRRRRPAPRG
jgi:DNA-binding transcriptional LysR family regulator